MRILSQVERPVDAFAEAKIANRLGDRQDVRLRETAVVRRTPVATGAEAHKLARIAQIGLTVMVIPLEFGNIDQQVLRGGFTRQRRNGHGVYFVPEVPPHMWIASTFGSQYS